MLGQMIEAAAIAVAASEEILPQTTTSYPRFEAIMTSQGYDWEPIKVTTEDGYILTTFHILGKTGQAVKAT